VPAREARGVELAAGEQLAVVNVSGAQVGDLFAFCLDDVTEYLSAEHTRGAIRRLFPLVGESFVTNRRRPILTLVEDTSPGVHDFLIAACDPHRYRMLGVPDGHASCADNLHHVARDAGFTPATVPQPVNLFMNTPVVEHGRIDYRTSVAKPGDRVVLRAETDVVIVLSCCPMDVIAISDGGLTDLAMEMVA
jgi:uncharacterized protein YcgI (DUF1989 family)